MTIKKLHIHSIAFPFLSLFTLASSGCNEVRRPELTDDKTNSAARTSRLELQEYNLECRGQGSATTDFQAPAGFSSVTYSEALGLCALSSRGKVSSVDPRVPCVAETDPEITNHSWVRLFALDAGVVQALLGQDANGLVTVLNSRQAFHWGSYYVDTSFIAKEVTDATLMVGTEILCITEIGGSVRCRNLYTKNEIVTPVRPLPISQLQCFTYLGCRAKDGNGERFGWDITRSGTVLLPADRVYRIRADDPLLAATDESELRDQCYLYASGEFFCRGYRIGRVDLSNNQTDQIRSIRYMWDSAVCILTDTGSLQCRKISTESPGLDPPIVSAENVRFFISKEERYTHFCAITDDERLICKGATEYRGKGLELAALRFNKVVDVSNFLGRFCVIERGKGIICSGGHKYFPEQPLDPDDELARFVVAKSHNHFSQGEVLFCAISRNRAAYCWGSLDNYRKQMNGSRLPDLPTGSIQYLSIEELGWHEQVFALDTLGKRFRLTSYDGKSLSWEEASGVSGRENEILIRHPYTSVEPILHSEAAMRETRNGGPGGRYECHVKASTPHTLECRHTLGYSGGGQEESWSRKLQGSIAKVSVSPWGVCALTL